MGRRLRRGRSGSLDFRAVWRFPPALGETQPEALKATVQGLPGEAGIELANWNWRSVRQFVLERFGISLSRRSCLNYLHRLGFVLKQPKKRLVKADAANITVALVMKVSEGVSGSDIAWPGPGAAVSIPTSGWSGQDCHGAATAAGTATV